MPFLWGRQHMEPSLHPLQERCVGGLLGVLETDWDSRCLCIAAPRPLSPQHRPLAPPHPAPAHTSPNSQGDAPALAQSYHAKCPQDQPSPWHPRFQVTLLDQQLFKYSLTVFLSTKCFWLSPDPQVSHL